MKDFSIEISVSDEMRRLLGDFSKASTGKPLPLYANRGLTEYRALAVAIASLELDRARLNELERLIEADRLIVDNNSIPPVGIYVSEFDNETRNFYMLREVADHSLTPPSVSPVSSGEAE